MKWKDFLEQAKKAGVSDEDKIHYVDILCTVRNSLKFHKDLKSGWAIEN